MAELGLDGVPVLGRPGRGCSRPGAGPVNPRGPGLLRPARRRAARARASSRGRRSTTGTCRSRWRTPAAGRRATPRTGSPTTPRSSHDALGDRVTALDHAQRAVVLGVPRLRLGRARARPHASRRAALRAAHHLLLGHGLAVAGAARPAPPTQVGVSAQPLRGRARDRRPRPTSTRRGGSTGCRTGSSSTRCCAGRYPADVLADLAPVTDFGHVRGRRPGVIVRAARRARASTTTAGTWSRRCRRGPQPAGRRDGCSPVGRQRRRRVRAAAARPVTAMGWEIDAGRADEVLAPGAPRVRRPAAVRHRERRRLRRRRDGGRRDPRPTSASPTWTRTCGACHDAIAAGVDAARLLRVVAARQLRVGLGLRQALRARARRLRDASAGG